MKSTAAVCAIALSALSWGSLSFAQDFNHNPRDRHAEPSRFEQRGPVHQDGRHFTPRPADHRDYQRSPPFHRGDRLPAQYRYQRVNNWQAQHLQAPARGQQWVQTGADYALIAIATGVIAQLVLNR